MKSLLPLAVLVLVISPVACGKKDNFAGSASVSGKVIWDKNPLQFGSVQFYCPETVHTALIQKDGSYKLEHLPEGQVTVCIRVRGELYADSRGDEQMKNQIRSSMKGKIELPDGMTVEEFKQHMMAKGGAKGKSAMPMLRKGRADDKMPEMVPLVNGNPLMVIQTMPPEALRKIGEVHDKYGEFSKSSLTYLVLPGAQTYDFILK